LKALIIFKQFFQDIRRQKLRTFLTTFGIVWGTTAIIILVAFGEGLFRHQQKMFLGLGEQLVIVWPGQTSLPYAGLPKGRWIRFIDEDIDMLKHEIPGIIRSSPEYSSYARITFERKTISQNVIGIYPEFGVVRNLIPEPGGRFLNNIDFDYRKRVVFLGTNVRNDLFGEGVNPVGKHVIIRGFPFLVIGVLKHKEQNSSYRGRDVYKVFVPSSTFKTMFNRRHPSNLIYQVANPDKSKSIEKKVFKFFGKKYKFNPEDDQALSVWDTNESMRQFKPFFTGFKIFLGIIGFFTLIVGGIGTANIMYVVVKERSKEIGLKMALGATRFHIMSQIITESLLMTAIGGTIGFIIAKVFETVFPYLGLGEYVGDPVISSSHVVLTITIIGTIGFLAGLFPARRASMLNPVEALRL
jgi:putative ABC transport system permease protein